MKICPLGAELFDVYRHMDINDEAHSRFSLICESAEKLALNSHHMFRNGNDCWSNSCLWTSPLAVLVFLRMNNPIQKQIFLFTTTEQPPANLSVCTNATDEGIVSALIGVISWKGRKCRSGLKIWGPINWRNKGGKERLDQSRTVRNGWDFYLLE